MVFAVFVHHQANFKEFLKIFENLAFCYTCRSLIVISSKPGKVSFISDQSFQGFLHDFSDNLFWFYGTFFRLKSDNVGKVCFVPVYEENVLISSRRHPAIFNFHIFC